MKPEQHILEVSDTYVGSKELTEMDAYLLDNNRMIKKNILHTPALYKIFDELLVNSADQHIRCKKEKYKNQVTNN